METDIYRRALAAKGVKLVSIKENFDTSTPTGKLMLSLIAAINEFERQNLLERQREGIAIAKRQGKYVGRKPKKYDEVLLQEVMTGLEHKTITVTHAAKKLGVTRATVYNLIKKYNRKDADNLSARVEKHGCKGF